MRHRGCVGIGFGSEWGPRDGDSHGGVRNVVGGGVGWRRPREGGPPHRSFALVFRKGSHGGGTYFLGGGGAFTRIGDHGIGEADGGGPSHGVFGDRGGR